MIRSGLLQHVKTAGSDFNNLLKEKYFTCFHNFQKFKKGNNNYLYLRGILIQIY